MNFNTKAKLAIVFQPYLLIACLGLSAAYAQYEYGENKYMVLTGISFFLGNIIIYIYLLLSKSMVIRSMSNFLIVGACLFMNSIGEGNYNFGSTSSVLMSVGILLLYTYEFKVAKRLINENDFIKNTENKPEYTLFFDDGLLNLLKRKKEDKKIKFSNEMYTYINNEIVFDHKGIKNTEYSFDDVKKYMAESFQTIKDFNKDSLKTIEMLKY
jgi:hypothetical protein